MFCELLGKEEGYCRGKGGSMHIADQSHGNLGANAIVGGSMGIATGSALRAKLQGKDDVTVCFFGDGATAQGLWYEVMNMAALWNLPVIYACENNGYSEYTKTEEIAAGSIMARAEAFGIESHQVDGQDVLAVNADAQAGGALPQGRGPVLHRTDDLPLPRPPRGRHQPRILPLEGRGKGLEGQPRPDHPLPASGSSRRGSRARRRSRR
jgi:TPP-dependent pyruvate/acetoin dehydrogenase alpha subunit